MTQLDPLGADLLEQCAYQVLSSIERTVSAIKGVEAFSPNNRKRPPLEQVNLVTILDSQGIFQRVRETISFVENKLGTTITDWNKRDVCASVKECGNQRTTLVQLVLLPLLDALFTCYRLIDSIPQPLPPQSKNETKPPPPRGMLSLQNYTDVGAILEFTVCTSLLPCLEVNVLGSVRDRAQYLLPKSLAGRLPRVFVISAASSQADTTAAALRLSKTLVVVNDDNDYSKLCIQLVQLLDVDVETMSSTEFASAVTVWACLDQLPRQQVLQCFLPILTEGIFPKEGSCDLHSMVRRLLVLFAVVPVSHSTTAVCDLILSPIPSNKATTLLSQIVRLASLTTIEDAEVKHDAAMALRMFCCLMERTTFSFCGEEVDGLGLLSVCLLYAVAPNKWDIDGSQYRLAVGNDTMTRSNDLTLVTSQDCPIDEASVLRDVETRASVVVKEAVKVTELKTDSLLARCMFQHLLLTIFSLSQKLGSTNCSPDLRLSVMILLPILCESLSPEALLLGASSGASEILATFKLILDCAASSLDDYFHQSQGNRVSGIVVGFNKASRLFHSMAPECDLNRNQVNGGKDSELEDMLMSTASIALSLLTAMLELGSDYRNAEEVALLEDTIPSLRVLSTVASNSRAHGSEAAKLQAEVAEMASHAAALIVSRKARVEINNLDNRRENMSLAMIIAEAENEIQSDHPAVRAQGVVRLRHLARGCLADRGEQLPTTPKMVDISEPLSSLTNVDVIHEILRVSLLTLADPESYVYLAGIQTIVAIADVNPRVIIPLIGIGISVGEVQLNAGSVKTVLLTQNERIKLAEALLFVVRRRGPGIDQYMSQILMTMMRGHRQVQERMPPNDAKIIQEQTHDFFTSDTDHTNELTAPSDRLEAKMMRAGAGGPIFTAELNDVLRSSCVAIIVELVDAALPSSIAAYATDLVSLVKNAFTN
ncbi:Required for nuclear transport of RNA pol II C-terminus 1 [Fragilaria crotonensis]|nr:Required for nuclear transport of RNA pol II C-terminus 1 [Fragilaria crotonensis]